MNKWVNSIHCFISDWGINYISKGFSQLSPGCLHSLGSYGCRFWIALSYTEVEVAVSLRDPILNIIIPEYTLFDPSQEVMLLDTVVYVNYRRLVRFECLPTSLPQLFSQ